MHQDAFGAIGGTGRAPPVTARGLTALPSCIKGKGRKKRRGRGRVNGEGTENDPRCLKFVDAP